MSEPTNSDPLAKYLILIPALVLISAAVLKTQFLITSPRGVLPSPFDSRILTAILVQFELLVGVALLAFAYARLVRWIALGTFVVF